MDSGLLAFARPRNDGAAAAFAAASGRMHPGRLRARRTAAQNTAGPHACRPATANHRECGAPDRGNDMFRLSRRCLLALIAFTVAPAHAPALAQSYPSRPITIIVPLAPGTRTGTLARFYSEQLSQARGKPVVIENKPGAGLMLGTAAIAS